MKLTISDIVVPQFMQDAAWSCHCKEFGVDTSINTIMRYALLALTENPLVPSDQESENMRIYIQKNNPEYLPRKHYAVEWQRRMFLRKPDPVPAEVDALMWKTELGNTVIPQCRQTYNESILKAYNMGLAAKDGK